MQLKTTKQPSTSMIKVLLTTAFFCTSSVLLSQKNSDRTKEKITLDTEQNRKAIGVNNDDLSTKLNGTYQVILSEASHQFAFNDDFFVWLDRSRKEDEDQYIKVDTFVTIYIPSKKTLTKDDFVPLETTVVKL